MTIPEEELAAILNPSVRGMVERAFPDAPVMLDIAEAESKFDPLAKNPNSTATGVFQILIGTWNDPTGDKVSCEGVRTNAADNIKCARRLYDAYGTAPWLASSANW